MSLMEAPMNFASVDSIKAHRFEGFMSISGLKASRYSNVKNVSGVYMVLRLDTTPPVFLLRSTGGRHKGQDPTLPREQLQEQWVDRAIVVYIGQTIDLKKRLHQYFDPQEGQSTSHNGGRCIWQLEGSKNLLVCWKASPNPKGE